MTLSQNGPRAHLFADECIQTLGSLKVLQAVQVVKAIMSALNLESMTSKATTSTTDPEELIDNEIKLLNETIRERVRPLLHQSFNGALKYTIKTGLMKVVRAGYKLAGSKMWQAMDVESPSEAVKGLKEGTNPQKETLPSETQSPPPETQLESTAEMEENVGCTIIKPKINEKDKKVQEYIKKLADPKQTPSIFVPHACLTTSA